MYITEQNKKWLYLKTNKQKNKQTKKKEKKSSFIKIFE